MAALFRIMMMFAGYTAACIAASLVLTIGTLTPEWNDVMNSFGVPSPAVQSAALWTVVALGTVVIFAVGFLPTLLVMIIAEGLALRSAVIYGVIGGLLALAGAYGLDFAGYIASARRRSGARARSVRRGRDRRRIGLLAVRRPPGGRLEMSWRSERLRLDPTA